MDQNIFDPLILWIESNPTYAGLMVFLISLSESLVGIGFFVPGVVFMTAIGALVGAGVLSLGPTLIWAILGAIVGDGLSYYLGFHYKDQMKALWLFRKYPKLLLQASLFFKKHGGKSVVAGRFIGPIRPVIPVIAGMMHMSPRDFLFANILSAVLWAPIYSLPGFLLGNSLDHLTPEITLRISAYVLGLLALTWTLYVVIKALQGSVYLGLHKLLTRLWYRIKRSSGAVFFTMLLRDKRFPHSRPQIGQCLLLCCTSLCFAGITWIVMHQSFIYPWNETVRSVLRAFRAIVDFPYALTIVTATAEKRLILCWLIPVGAYLLFRKRFAALLMIGTSLAILEGIHPLLKELFHHPRPEGIVGLPQNFSYPSGHSFAATLLFGTLALMIARELKHRFRFIPILLWLSLCVSVMFSRLYLQPHWLFDVLGGFSLGLSILFILNIAYRRMTETHFPWRMVTALFITGLCSGIIYFHSTRHFATQAQRYTLTWPIETVASSQLLPTMPLRHNAFGRVAEAFSFTWSAALTDLDALLAADGYEILKPFQLSQFPFLFSNKPKLHGSFQLPAFHFDRLPIRRYYKLINETKIIISLWESNIDLNGTVIYEGLIGEAHRKHPLPLITIYKLYPERNDLLPEVLRHSR